LAIYHVAGALQNVPNSNIEIRNPKQYQNPNAQNSKQKRYGIGICVLVIDIFVSEFRNSEAFEFVSNFDIRISDFPVPDSWIKYI